MRDTKENVDSSAILKSSRDETTAQRFGRCQKRLGYYRCKYLRNNVEPPCPNDVKELCWTREILKLWKKYGLEKLMDMLGS
jgi:hypothetical protein